MEEGCKGNTLAPSREARTLWWEWPRRTPRCTLWDTWPCSGSTITPRVGRSGRASTAMTTSTSSTPSTCSEEDDSFMVPYMFVMVLDMDAGTLAFVVDGQYLGVAHSGLRGKKLFPIVSRRPWTRTIASNESLQASYPGTVRQESYWSRKSWRIKHAQIY